MATTAVGLEEPLSEEWPSLSASTSGSRPKKHVSSPAPTSTTSSQPRKVVDFVITNGSNEQREENEDDDDDEHDNDNDWEDIADPQEDDGARSENSDEIPRAPNTLHHCASSPNLRYLSNMPQEFLEDVQEEVEEEPHHDDDGESFSMLESVASVQSISTFATTTTAEPTTTTTSDSPNKAPLSWKDKVALLAKEGSGGNFSPPASMRKKFNTAPFSEPPKKSKSRFVVVVQKQQQPGMMRRCSKSTGDLQSLLEEDDEEEIMGDSDAMEFYHRKAKGAAGRSSGLRLRPDEAKRKAMTLHKKSLQRTGRL